jgi:hypothetical protein
MPKNNKTNLGVIKYTYECMLELVECKFARNGLTNWKTFFTNIFENIIWHLFAGESHQLWKSLYSISHIWLCNRSLLVFLIYEENLGFFFISASLHIFVCLYCSSWNTGTVCYILYILRFCYLVLYKKACNNVLTGQKIR